MNDLMLKISDISKEYRLGQIGGTTLRDELQRVSARLHHQEDPTRKIGSVNYNQGEKFTALSHISFSVNQGERVAIIGRNGAGKSTLLKLISRITSPTDGSIDLYGRVASMLEIGTGFHPELTGRENIYMNGAILGMTRREIDSKLEDIIDFSECRQFIDTPVKRYSSGMYVKLAFAVAAHLDSEILIMDEVLAVGDAAFQKKCIDKMNQLSGDDNRTILYVSHNMNTVRQLCTRCLVLQEGSLVYDGDVEEGISLYLGSQVNELPCHYDLSDIHRKRAFYARSVRITSFDYADSIQACFSQDRSIGFRISYEAVESVPNLQLLLIIEDEAGMPLGMYQTDRPFGDASAGSGSAAFNINPGALSPGNYMLGVGIFVDPGDHRCRTQDLVSSCISLRITEGSGENLRWVKSVFGDIKLGTIHISK